MEIKTTICDICRLSKPTQPIKYPVMFHTDQTEGRAREPYLSIETLDVCTDCLPKIVKVHGWGAQGYNEYKLKE